MNLLWVGLGGFVGSVLRYLVAVWLQPAGTPVAFPWATVVVNVIGCFFIGALAVVVETRHLLPVEARLFLIVGVLGGFTTFSAFGNDTVNLMRDGRVTAAAINILAHGVLCLAAVWLGRAAALAVAR